MFYLIIFLVITFFAFIDIYLRFNNNSRNFIYYTLFLIFWFVAGLRYETGIDWLVYTTFYNGIDPINTIFSHNNIFTSSRFEYGYVILNSIFKLITDNIQLLFFTIAFITNLLLFNSLKKYSDYFLVSLLIYYCTIYFMLDLSGIRQCIAINLFFWSLNFVIEKKFIKYLLIIILAGFFHRTAMLLIPLYFLFNKEFKNRTLLLFIAGGVLIAVLQIKWLKVLLGEYFILLEIGEFSNKIKFYTTDKTFGTAKSFGYGMVINFVIFIFGLLNRKKYKENKIFNLFLNMYVLNLFFYYFAWEVNEISLRLRMYFLIGNTVLFAYFINIYKDYLKKFAVFIFIISFSLFYGRIYLFEMPMSIAYNPYQNYLIYELFNIQSTGHERLNEQIVRFKAQTKE